MVTSILLKVKLYAYFEMVLHLSSYLRGYDYILPNTPFISFCLHTYSIKKYAFVELVEAAKKLYLTPQNYSLKLYLYAGILKRTALRI